VYFAGELLEGQPLASVREKLGKLFKADEATLDKLFSGKAQLLKRDCDEATALKYQQAMELAGARPIVKANQAPESPATAVTEPARPTTAADRIAALAQAPDMGAYDAAAETAEATAAAQTPEESSEGINLAPPGTETLKPDERAEPIVNDIDTSALDVDESAQRLSQEPPPPPAAPDTAHLSMADAGEDIPNLPSDAQPLSPDIDALELAPEGTDFSDCAAPPAQAPALDLSAIEVAPEGSDVLEEKYRDKTKVTAPDTDHLSLEN
jgi:hypothetical protein